MSDQEALLRAVSRLQDLAHAVDEAGLRVRAEAGHGWRSAAGDAFTQRMLELGDQVRACAARLDQAAETVHQHADRCAVRALSFTPGRGW